MRYYFRTKEGLSFILRDGRTVQASSPEEAMRMAPRWLPKNSEAVSVDPPPLLESEIEKFQSGQRLQAVKDYRQRTTSSFQEAIVAFTEPSQ